MSLPRLRQLVMGAWSPEAAGRLAGLLGLGEGFRDPGVSAFGIENRVFALGDQFLEVVLPGAEPSALSRFLHRSGEGGYMAIFQTDDIDAARHRTRAMGIRHVWSADLDEISAVHLHPSDTGAAIISIDTPRPAGSWLWGGPGWAERSVPGALAGAELEDPDPSRLAAHWAGILGVKAEGASIVLGGERIDVRPGPVSRLSAFRVRMPDPGEVMKRAAGLGLDACGNRVALAGIDLVIEPL